ncbi:MAG: hypothetical protein OXI56_05710 [bacterium]|nr:hypothetical protein [bacterium]MDE0601273.1 hypothetical protein [bacterium]
MNIDRVEEALSASERAVAEGRGLAGTGFWKAVGTVKRNPDLINRYASRIAEIDRRAFLGWAVFSVGAGVGTALMALATLAGAVLVVWSYGLPDPWNGLVMLGGGGGVLVTTTHGLGHLAVGRLAGIRFTHWFVGSLSRPQPGVKVDYDTYLRAGPRSRAWMHASGALVTKAVPFVLLGLALAADFPSWVAWLLAAQGVLQVITDALWSVKLSDWKKFRREMSYR